MLANAKYIETLDKSKKLLEYLEPLTKSKIPEKEELIATINSNMGNAYLEISKYDSAITAHQKDLDISTKK